MDEINQGMDAQFETAVMTQLVAGSTADDHAGAGAGAGAGSSAGGKTPRLGERERELALAAEAGYSAAAAGAAGGRLRSGRQLFIISPKLLQNLSHSPLIRSEVVFNGSKMGVGLGPAGAIMNLFMSKADVPSE